MFENHPDLVSDAVPDKGDSNNIKASLDEQFVQDQKEKKTTENNESPKENSTNSRKSSANGIVVNFNACDRIHIGSNILFQLSGRSFGGQTERTTHRPCSPSPQIKKTLESRRKVEKEDIEAIKNHIGFRWRPLGRELGFPDGRLDQFEMDYKILDEVIFQMILEWVNMNGELAVVGLLCRFLWKSDCKDAALQLSLRLG